MQPTIQQVPFIKTLFGNERPGGVCGWVVDGWPISHRAYSALSLPLRCMGLRPIPH
ncbi:hypothetical protein [Halomonas citrativorans]|uniref:hypothetical protein n=1 Tax=Halomonas TaxID=2745 RepID=UPI001868EAC9|nr:hypothetical protein [Halomonas citrativorans]